MTLRRNEWERRLPGKLMNIFTGYRAISVEKYSTYAPHCYSDIQKRDDRTKWLEAGTKWVFHVMEDEGERTVRNVGRLVAKGYLQRHSVDFEDIMLYVNDLLMREEIGVHFSIAEAIFKCFPFDGLWISILGYEDCVRMASKSSLAFAAGDIDKRTLLEAVRQPTCVVLFVT